jgi:hypothetical protein
VRKDGAKSVQSPAFSFISASFFIMRRSSSFQTMLKDCLEVICEYNPWFPEEGTLDEEVWDQACKNVEKAYRQGEKIPVHFWITWALVKSVILILG